MFAASSAPLALLLLEVDAPEHSQAPKHSCVLANALSLLSSGPSKLHCQHARSACAVPTAALPPAPSPSPSAQLDDNRLEKWESINAAYKDMPFHPRPAVAADAGGGGGGEAEEADRGGGVGEKGEAHPTGPWGIHVPVFFGKR